MDVPQDAGAEGEGQPPLPGQTEAVWDPAVGRGEAQQPGHQGLVGAVALSGGGKGAVEQQLGPDGLLPQQSPGHAADAHRPRRVGAGGPHHDGTQDVEQVHRCVPPLRSHVK